MANRFEVPMYVANYDVVTTTTYVGRKQNKVEKRTKYFKQVVKGHDEADIIARTSERAFAKTKKGKNDTQRMENIVLLKPLGMGVN